MKIIGTLILIVIVIFGIAYISDKQQDKQFVELCEENNGLLTHSSSGLNCEFGDWENSTYLYEIMCGDYYVGFYTDRNIEQADFGLRFNLKCTYTKEALK